MIATTTLVLGVHGHQPVGNFGWVFGEAHAKAYRPFLDVIERHPTIRWSVHLSGPLVEWLVEERLETLERLAGLVRRGQVEVLGGGYAEPILCWLPERDALGQLTRFTRQLTRLRLGPCRGAWLTERVWEPSLPRLFRAAGLEYTVVDDHHLTLAGVRERAAVGYWVTEDAGATVALFPSSKALRYLVPFKPVEEVIDHLRTQRSETPRAVILADDLEKFGFWPGTHRWVYEEGWFERFCRALEAERDWLTTATFSQVLDTQPPQGRVYVPCASYPEMMEWSGGHVRNFLVKYPEANRMHKKMLWVSDRVAAARQRRPSAAVRRAETHLYRGQGNDAYWHGVFGGIYLNHLRSAVYRELLTAERLLDQAAHRTRPWASAEALDLDGDGQPELLLRSALMDVTIDPARGGAIVEWDDKGQALNLVNTVTRRREAYHEKLLAAAPQAVGAAVSGAPETIHAGLRVKEPGLQDHLVFDAYRRVAAIDHLWTVPGEAAAFARGQVAEADNPAEQAYRWRLVRRADGVGAVLQRDGCIGDVPVRLTKTITLARRARRLRVDYVVTNLGPAPVTARIGSEWNLALKDPHFNRVGALAGIRRLVVTDRHQAVAVELATSVEAGGWYFPVETVSDSESGLERTYQQMNITLWWDIELVPRRPWRVTLTSTVLSEESRAAG